MSGTAQQCVRLLHFLPTSLPPPPNPPPRLSSQHSLRFTSLRATACCSVCVQTANIPAADLLYVNYSNLIEGLLPYSVALDVARRCVVVAIRGSLSVEDCVTGEAEGRCGVACLRACGPFAVAPQTHYITDTYLSTPAVAAAAPMTQPSPTAATTTTSAVQTSSTILPHWMRSGCCSPHQQ